MGEFDKLLIKVFIKKSPPLSPNLQNSATRVLPWIFIIFGVLGLFAVLSATLSFSFNSLLAMGMGRIMGITIPSVGFVMIYLFTPLLQLFSIAAGYYMLKRQFKGWQLAVVTTLLSLLTHILYQSPIGVILDLLFIYILYQIKERYT